MSKYSDNLLDLGSTKKLDIFISELIKKEGITKEDNNFFKEAKKTQNINAYPAMIIAANWREITKTFMFTTLTGIGNFAEVMGSEYAPNKNLLKVLQTSVSVISDDINNTFAIFNKKAPKGFEGIHYLWWESTILDPLKKACSTNNIEINTQSILLPTVKHLTAGMVQLSKNILGFAVQLRIVEEIALDICLAFRPLFGAVTVNNKKLFSKREDLDWIYSHITAEVVHNNQVKDSETGMVIIAQTNDDKDTMIKLSREYIKLWAMVFDEFALTIQSH